jgi:hypothetical protein
MLGTRPETILDARSHVQKASNQSNKAFVNLGRCPNLMRKTMRERKVVTKGRSRSLAIVAMCFGCGGGSKSDRRIKQPFVCLLITIKPPSRFFVDRADP